MHPLARLVTICSLLVAPVLVAPGAVADDPNCLDFGNDAGNEWNQAEVIQKPKTCFLGSFFPFQDENDWYKVTINVLASDSIRVHLCPSFPQADYDLYLYHNDLVEEVALVFEPSFVDSSILGRGLCDDVSGSVLSLVGGAWYIEVRYFAGDLCCYTMTVNS